jgi:hypothetical protein
MTNVATLIEKLHALPPDRLGEVEDFVDFIAAKSRRLVALDRLLALVPALEAAGAPQMTDDDVAAEVAAGRAERRARGDTQRSA